MVEGRWKNPSEVFEEFHIGYHNSIYVGKTLPIGRGKRKPDPPVGVLQQEVGLAACVHFEEGAFAIRKRRKEKTLPVGKPSRRLKFRPRGRWMNYLDLFIFQVQHMHIVTEMFHQSNAAPVGGKAPVRALVIDFRHFL